MTLELVKKWKDFKTDDFFMLKDAQKKSSKLSKNFESKISFSSDGVQGKMGLGTSCINELTVSIIANSYATFIKNNNNKKVVIGHDNRHNSDLFAKVVASILLANNIETYIFDDNKLQPTSFVSYVIRKGDFSGGIVISSSKNSKSNNGIKMYGKDGSPFSEDDYEKMQETLWKIDPFKVKKSTENPKIVNKSFEDDYIKDISDISLNNEGGLKLVFSPQNGTSSNLGQKVLKTMNNKVYLVEKQLNPDPTFKYSKTSDPEGGKAFKKSLAIALKNKVDAMITTNTNANKIGIAVKYKKRYKYLNGNQLACLYLEYYLTQLKHKNLIPEDGYIVSTVVSTTMVDSIAQKFGVRVVRTHKGFKNISNKIDAENGQFIFAFEESYGFIVKKNVSRVKDSFQAMIAVMDMLSYFKSKNINAYEELKKMYVEYGIHRNYHIFKKIDKQMLKKLEREFKHTKKIGNNKVLKVINYKMGDCKPEKAHLIKIMFKGGSTVSLLSKKDSDEVDVYIENVGKPNEDISKIITFEKEVETFINDNTEKLEDKKFTWKALIKYFIFVLILAGTIALVFNLIYSDVSNPGKTNIHQTISAASAIWRMQDAWPWLILWVSKVMYMFLSAWSKKRMFMIMGEKVKTRHLVLSSIMGSIVAFITPMTIGGDAVGYWYLRRKGVKRAPLIAALSSSTLIGEAKFTLQTVFLVAIGWPLYVHVFNGDAESKAALVWFFIGLGWTVFSTIMIFIVTLSSRFQNFIIKYGIVFLEWFRFTHIYDPWRKTSELRYEFATMRSGMKRIWTTWYFPFELMFYSMLPLFFQPVTIIFATSGLMSSATGVDPYFSMIVGNDIIGTANSMSFLPGGSGTGEWLSRAVNSRIFDASNFGGIYDPAAIANGKDLFWKIISVWPWLIISAVLTIFVVFIESAHKRRKQLKIACASTIVLLVLSYLVTYFMIY